jgi:uncharacterized protein (DUF1778 family)
MVRIPGVDTMSDKPTAQRLADRRYFALSSDRWQEFCDRLDAPPKDLPHLRRLLEEASVLDLPTA